MSEVEFVLSDVPSSEIDRLESFYVPLADCVRELVDATIRTTVDEDEARAVHAEVTTLVRRLRAAQIDGPAGVHVNEQGRSWSWGNAVIGRRNAAAPPLTIVHDPDGLAHCDVVLGAAAEGPPGHVHGGVTALMLDHLMGETASAFRRLTMTGTLTMRYRRATPLGGLRLEERIDREEGRKVYVVATVADADGVTVEAEGVFIVPSWSV
ncbi:PaaI family thioesterase [Rhodococcus sp. X156]|uniref:PaaI family thioesterase n=1 Tax=Rhodococcus sp. X156 TaxID=2499145 RepID=UPI001F495146|nr:PaaI family thioesterase [Rhodococcus sp. X156]